MNHYTRQQIIDTIKSAYKDWQYYEMLTEPEYDGAEEEAQAAHYKGVYEGCQHMASVLTGSPLSNHEDECKRELEEEIRKRIPENEVKERKHQEQYGSASWFDLPSEARMEMYEWSTKLDEDRKVLAELTGDEELLAEYYG